MRNFGTLLTLILGLSAGTVFAVPAVPSSDQSKIEQLVGKLGSANFRERDAANKELDAIGEPALEALRKAAKSNDMETASRAAALVGKIEQRSLNARLVAPTYVELNLKEATIDDAIAELSKKSGYSIVIAGEKTKMSDRRVTLDTGRVPFWKAFDMLCQKAGLVEADPNTPLPPGIDLPGQPLPPQIQPLPPIRIQPLKPIQKIQPIQIKPINVKPIQIQPLPVEKPVPAEKPVEDKPAEKPQLPQGFNAQQPAPQKEEVPPQRAQAPAIQVVPAVQPVPVQGGAIGGRVPPRVNNGLNAQIIVVDGKPSTAASDLETAFRIRAINDPNVIANYGPVPAGEIGMVLEVKGEPKIQLQQILGVKIDKAIDNYDQVLTPTMVSGINPNPANDVDQLVQMKLQQIQIQGNVQVQINGRAYNPNGVYYGNNYVSARLKKGEKEAKSLKEVRGVVSLKMRTAVEELAAVENIMKAKGETVKGNDSTLKILDVSKAENGEITVQVELQYSNEVQPLINRAVPQPINPNIRLQIAPAPAQAVPPVPPPANAPNAVAVQPAVYNSLGLEMIDAKGEGLQLIKMQTRTQIVGGARTMTTTMTFKPQKDQEASKFVFRGSRAATVDVPFLLKDVVIK